MTAGELAAVDALVWAAWSVVVGAGVHLLPDRWFERDTWLTRPRAFEAGGRLFERVHIRRWKDRLPDAGAVFAPGASKRALVGRSPAALARFALETRRAEYVHVAIAGLAPLFWLWNPVGLTAAMCAYALVANVPCIAIQRYNRARLARAWATATAAATSRRQPVPTS